MKRLTFLFFGLLVLSSCEQDLILDVDGGHTKLFAFSEITTDSKIKVEVNTAVGINTDDKFTFPKQSDALVVLLQDGEELADPGFRYIAREKAFISQGAFTPEAGVEYSLKISLKDNEEVKPILATTTIPKPEVLEDVLLRSFTENQLNPTEKEFIVKVDVGFNEMKAPHYIVKPFYIDSNGEKKALLVQELTSGNNSAQYSRILEGVLVNNNMLSERLGLVLINDGSVDVDSKIERVFVEVHTITLEGYMYYKSLNRQVDSQAAAVSEPVISYTNFDEGLGLFTGYSSSVTTIEIQ